MKDLTKFRAFFNQVGFCKEARLEATKAIFHVAKMYYEPCVALNGSICCGVREKDVVSTFTDADVQVPYPHNSPIYIPAMLYDEEFKRTLLDGEASLNIMPLSTFKAAGIPKEKLIP